VNPARTPRGKRWLAVLAGLWLPAWAVMASQNLPPSIVLVLNVLSDTHARPVTGVVLTGDGQLLVPAAFVARGDDIVVLSGGTDLQRNAKPTRTVARSSELGLAVLAAEGLQRPALPVSDDPPLNGEKLRFAAFPPAEELASGQGPIVEEVSVSVTSGEAATATPLPNLSGALLDACGYLAGVVLARGEPGLQRDTTPDVLLRDSLKAALEQLDVAVTLRPCRSSTTGPGNATATASATPTSGPQILDPGSLQPSGPDLGTRSAEKAPPRSDQPVAATPQPAGGITAAVTPDAAATTGTDAKQDRASANTVDPAASSSSQEHAGTGIGWATMGVLLGLALLAGWWLGTRKRARRTAPEADHAVPIAPHGEPAVKTAPAAVQQALSVRIEYPDGREETRTLVLNRGGPGLIIGRGQADLVIDHEHLARLHGRLELHSDHLLYCDLGSRWGSWVEGVACLEGERFCLTEAGQLQLGEIRLYLSLVADETVVT